MRFVAGFLLLAALATGARGGEDAPAAPAAPLYEGKNCAEWTAALASDDVKVRQTAAYALFKLGKDAAGAAPALVKALRDADEYVRMTSAKAIRRLPPEAMKPLVPGLIAELSSKQAEVRREAAWVLWRLDPLAAGVVPELTKALASEDAIVRANVLGCLEKVGAAAKPALPAIAKTLDDSDENVRNWAAKAVVAIDPVAAFASEKTALRLVAVQTYASPDQKGWTKPEIVSAVLKAIEDPTEEVRGWAVHALDTYALFAGDKRPVEWIEVFTKALTTSRTPGVQANAAYGLGRYAAHAPRVLPYLVAAAKNREPEAQRGAVLALGWLGAEARTAVPVVLDALRVADGETRSAAAVALGSLGDASDAVIDALVAQFDDEHRFAARNAIRAVGELGRGSPRAAAALAGVFLNAHADAYVCGDAMTAVKVAGLTEPVLATLKASLTKDPRERPAVAFAVCALDPAADRKELDGIVALAEADPPRADAIAFLRLLGPKSAPAVPALTKLLGHTDAKVRMSAAVALGAIGAGAKDALPALDGMKADTGEYVAPAATQAAVAIREALAAPK